MIVELSTYEVKKALKVLSKVNSDTYFSVAGGVTKLTRFDADTTLTVNIDGYSQEDGTVVMAEDVINIIRRLNADSFMLTERSISTGTKFIGLENSDGQYQVPKFKGEPVFVATQAELLSMLEIKYSAATDEIRPILKGICFNGSETCAIDGYRMAVRRGDYYSNKSFVLNINTVNILLSIMNPRSEGLVEVLYDEKCVMFRVSNVEIIGRTLEGTYINYKQIIPDDFRILSTVKSEDLKNELEFITGVKTNYLKMCFTKDRLLLKTDRCREELDKDASELRTRELQEEEHRNFEKQYDKWLADKERAAWQKKQFRTKAPEEKTIKPQKVYSLVPVAEIKIEVPCYSEFTTSDTEFSIGVNPKYLADGLSKYSGQVKIKMTSSVSPIVITQDDGALDLVLPVRNITY